MVVASPPPSPTTVMDECPAKPLENKNSDGDDSMRLTRRSRITFNERVAVHWIERTPEADRPDCYMSKSDYDAIRKDCASIVEKAKLDDALETRGLESSLLTGEGFLKAYLHRRGALRAVFKEQILQKQTGCKAPEEISSAYAVFSEKSLDEARLMAESDEVAMQQCYA
ncbi:MAG: hypothetical protein SGILL_003229 [Bacillariaceae sp.]